jgi:hypothetical protein
MFIRIGNDCTAQQEEHIDSEITFGKRATTEELFSVEDDNQNGCQASDSIQRIEMRTRGVHCVIAYFVKLTTSL